MNLIVLSCLMLGTLGCLVMTNIACAEDVMRWPDGGEGLSPKEQYKFQVAETALKKTVADYGAYKIEKIPVEVMSTQRAREVVRLGSPINVYTALTTKEWEEEVIPIRIPIRRGLISYRLLLIHKDNANMFSQIENLDQLKKIKVGSQLGWATTDILYSEGFNLVRGKKPDGMFYMLDGGRFDYLPRGVYEVFAEQAKYSSKMQLMVEPRLALNIPSPDYLFVSPLEKRLAKRLEAGLEIMIKDGTLKTIFYNAYGDDIKRAGLKDRIVLSVPNIALSAKTPFARKELWFDPSESVD
jgi:hypothetical protein